MLDLGVNGYWSVLGRDFVENTDIVADRIAV